jgi:hypothetical protein
MGILEDGRHHQNMREEPILIRQRDIQDRVINRLEHTWSAAGYLY